MSEESSTLGTTLHFVSSTGFRHPSSDTHTHTRPNRPRAIYSYVHPLSDTAGGGTRTLNHPLTGRVLFRLSYAGTIGRGPVRYLPATMDTTSDPTDYLARPSSQPEQRALPCNLTATLCAGSRLGAHSPSRAGTRREPSGAAAADQPPPTQSDSETLENPLPCTFSRSLPPFCRYPTKNPAVRRGAAGFSKLPRSNNPTARCSRTRYPYRATTPSSWHASCTIASATGGTRAV